jgi:Raf kinase inhibitor-like YbhB/YbcL family protein
MFMRFPVVVAAIALCTAGCSGLVGVAVASPSAKIARMTVTSPALKHGFLPPNILNGYGCTGENLSPALQWSGAPAGTKSFIVTLYDPDDRDSPSGWWHWVVYNIPGNLSVLPDRAGVDQGAQLPAGALHGRTDEGTLGYTGPCPDKGDAPHRYTFTVYALDVATLAVDAGASGAMVVETAHDHLLAKGDLVVRFGR